MQLRRRQQGDTIIEVMVAFSVFAMIAVGALTVMNQGTAGAQDTLETTLVRQQVDNQAELIRYLHQSYISNPTAADDTPAGVFRGLIATAQSLALPGPTKFGNACTQSLPPGRFALNSQGNPLQPSRILPVRNMTSSTLAPHAQLVDNGDADATNDTAYGLWIEPILSNDTGDKSLRYIDFHIRACWESASSNPQRTIGTIVRLYIPDNTTTGTTGAGSSATPATPPPPPTPPVVINGNSYTMCLPHLDVERFEGEGDPGLAQLPNTSGKDTSGTHPEWECKPVAAQSAVYSCVNYDSQYSLPSGFTSGTYKLSLRYGDMNCGNPSVDSGYKYKVGIYLNGNTVPSQVLSLDGVVDGSNLVSVPTSIGSLSAGTTIQVRWWNNHFYNGTGDPDFMIYQLILEKI